MYLANNITEYAITIAAKINLKYLKYLPNDIADDSDKMVAMALSVGRKSINYASERLLTSVEFLKEVITHFGNDVFVDLPINYKTNTMVIKLAQYGTLLLSKERGTRTFTYDDIVGIYDVSD